jgi:hypothetical protein
VVPLLKATAPPGSLVPDFGATAAVNVTDSPEVICMDEAESVVVVPTGETGAGVNAKTVAEYAGKL